MPTETKREKLFRNLFRERIKARTARHERLMDILHSFTKKRNELQENLRKQIVRFQRTIRDTTLVFRTLQREEQGLHADFDTIYSHPDVESVQIELGTKGRLRIFTNPIYIVHRGKKYKIGKFIIDVYPSGFKDVYKGQSFITMRNRSLRLCNMITGLLNFRFVVFHHPHILTKYGHPCLGNIKEKVRTLVEERNYSVLVALCIQYLKTYNGSDQGALPPVFWSPWLSPFFRAYFSRIPR